MEFHHGIVANVHKMFCSDQVKTVGEILKENIKRQNGHGHLLEQMFK